MADLFKASVSIEHLCDNKKETMVLLTNKSSLPYTVKVDKREVVIHAMSSVQFLLPKESDSVEFTVTNLICGGNKRVKVAMNFNRKPTNPYLKRDSSWYPR